jgi:D-aminoacyl-tRNA deacylase
VRVVLQRVKSASVRVDGCTVGSIAKGSLALVGIHPTDTPQTLEWMAQKLIQLRYFEDTQGKMNLSLQDVEGELLVISQFTLYGNCNEGRRPDFIQSAPASIAKPLFDTFLKILETKTDGPIQTGVFGANMEVSLVNDGPVTLILERS